METSGSIERDDRTVLVDPCVGNSKQRALDLWNDLSLPWMERFGEAGFDPALVDLVVHTHLHELRGQVSQLQLCRAA